MKINKLADKIMVYCVKQFYEDGTDVFWVPALYNVFPDETPDKIHMAIKLLKDEKLLNVFALDNTPENFQLLPSAIALTDEDTLAKKGYGFAKEIRDWLIC